MKKYKVLIIAAVPPPYHGVTIFNYNMLNSRLSDYYKIIHLDISDKRSLSNLGRVDFINIYLGVKNLFQLVFLLLKEQPKIVYLGIAQNKACLRDGLFIVLSKIFSKAKIIVHNHGLFKPYYEATNFLMRVFIDFILVQAHTFIVLADSLAYTVKKWAKNIEVVPNGINFNVPMRVKNDSREKVRVSYISNFSKSKGVIDALMAVRIVLEKYPEAHFSFAGSRAGEEVEIKDCVDKVLKGNCTADRICLCGFISGEEKKRFFAETDIFIFPTHHDSFGIVLLEAMASGCAIVATKVGAIPEIIIDKESGFLIEKENSQALAKAIIYLIENPEIRVKMGKAARRRYELHYTLDRNIESMKEVFDKDINDCGK